MLLEFTTTERLIHNQDWAVLVFMLTFGIIVVTRTLFEMRFADFTKLFFNDKYLKIYRDSSQLNSIFNILLFFVQLIALTFLILIFLDFQNVLNKHDFTSFIQVITLFGFFILSKYLIEKIIATSFELEDFIDSFNLYKLSYRTFLGLVAFPFAVIFYYNSYNSERAFYILGSTILLFHLFSYLKTLKSFQKEITSHLFYFILYLCALELAPYYFIYYWFIKK